MIHARARERRVGTELLEHVEPGTPRHHHVENDQIRAEPTRNVEALVAVARLDELVAVPVERGAYERAQGVPRCRR